MLSIETMPEGFLEAVKRKLNITWSDSDTDLKVVDLMMDAEIALNHILGAEDVDYSAPGMERQLFMNYCLYGWNDCLNEFEEAYRKELMRVRHIYRVKEAQG